eukprot:2312710-Prymnesium_polylepis.1
MLKGTGAAHLARGIGIGVGEEAHQTGRTLGDTVDNSNTGTRFARDGRLRFLASAIARKRLVAAKAEVHNEPVASILNAIAATACADSV